MKTEAMNLKDSKEKCMGGLEGRKEKEIVEAYSNLKNKIMNLKN